MHLGGTRLRPAIAATILLFVAACSDPQPIEPSPTSATTAVATPTVTAPAMPDQAQENTPEGAAAFVKHYIDVFNYASNTGNTEELTRLSATSCEACDKYASEFRAIYDRGDKISTHLWTLKSVDLEQGSGFNRVTAGVDVDEGKVQRYAFLFQMPDNQPFKVQSITILEDP